MIKSLVKFFIALMTSLGIYTYLYYSETGETPNLQFALPALSFLVVISILGMILLTICSRILTHWISWNKQMALRFVMGLALNSIVLYLLVVASYQAIIPFDEFWRSLFGSFTTAEISLKLQILIFVTIFIHSISDVTIFSYKQFATGQIESAKLTRRQYQLQFEALKSQLSPHYLFNCLNTISSLVYTNPEDAETFIRKLVQTYQYILNTKDEKLVTLGRELEFIRAYNYLLKIRYPEGLTIEIDLPETIHSTMLPPLTLQMLIENAVKHNDLSELRPLHIRVALDDDQLLSVSNSKNEKRLKIHSFNIGIENIKNRYRFFTEKSIKIINEDLFKVGLPLLTLNQNSYEEGLHS